jgi:hypothetical protein
MAVMLTVVDDPHADLSILLDQAMSHLEDGFVL